MAPVVEGVAAVAEGDEGVVEQPQLADAARERLVQPRLVLLQPLFRRRRDRGQRRRGRVSRLRLPRQPDVNGAEPVAHGAEQAARGRGAAAGLLLARPLALVLDQAREERRDGVDRVLAAPAPARRELARMPRLALGAAAQEAAEAAPRLQLVVRQLRQRAQRRLLRADQPELHVSDSLQVSRLQLFAIARR